MMSFWMMRLAVSRTLFNFFGYLSPALNSTKAIISKDEEGIREYLTYWCVFGLLLYVEFLLNFFSALRNWPPESKVLFILWLTLPQFQGAFRIYSYVVKPYFEIFEDEIDKQIDNISRGVSEKAHRHIQTILWQLFLAPNDGLLSGALSMSSSFSSTSMMKSFLFQKDDDQSHREILQLHIVEQEPPPPPRVTSLSLRKQLLENFTQMLIEGIYADVHHSDTMTVPDAVESEMLVTRVSILKGGCHLQFRRELFESTVECSSRSQSNLTDSDSPSSFVKDVYVPLFLVGTVRSDDYDSKLIVMSIPNTSSSISNSSSYLATTSTSVSALADLSLEGRIVCMRVEDEEEGEALAAGLIVLCADTRKRVTKRLDRACYLLQRLHCLSVTFKIWERF